MSHKPDTKKNVNLTIDGIHVTVPNGTMILDAAKKAHVKIPVLCDHPDLCKRAICRICVVENEGRSKLLAACSNEVWEGANIVTNSHRIIDIRKTIVELILANHPQDCLYCVRNKNCELQSLAESLGIHAIHFHQTREHHLPSVECETIVRDMNKCVKCTRCVEECQETQNIRAINTSKRSHDFGVIAPYKQPLKESSCVFCGQCVSVCPVGAIYEYDQSDKIRESLYDKKRKTIAQFSPAFISALNHEFSNIDEHMEGFGHKFLSAPVTKGKLIAAIRMLGFDKVFDESISLKVCRMEQNDELRKRIKSSKKPKLPLITGCSEGVSRFVKNFYPELTDHLLSGNTPQKFFEDVIKKNYTAVENISIKNITTVTFVPCIAQKYYEGKRDKTDFTLSAKELMRMIIFAGIDISALKEEYFDTVSIGAGKKIKGFGPYELEQQKQNVHETPKITRGLAQARKVMESIQKGECKTNWVEIHSCVKEFC